MMRKNKSHPSILLAVFALAACAFDSYAQPSVLVRAAELEEVGKFKEAASILQSALAEPSTNSSQGAKKEIEFELDRLERIRKDYSLTKESLFQQLQKSVRELSETEFEQWIAEGRFDTREIDGKASFMVSSRSNLFFRYPDVRPRRINAPDEDLFERTTWETVQAITNAAAKQGAPYVLPKQFKVTMTVSARPNIAPAGATVRAWLPIPREYPHQKDFRFLAALPAVKSVSSAQSPIRSAYLERPAVTDQATQFRIDYSYTAYGVRFSLKPEEVTPHGVAQSVFKEYTLEGPHMVFTEKMRMLSEKLVAGNGNPLERAKRFYDWITENIQYSYALEYSTIRNIGDYCLTRKYGDCGQAALLFMTLCRYNGIPARWQSGWLTMPGGKTIHDWTEIYIEPYGWFPVDPYMGVFAMQYMASLNETRRKEVRDFYFGGLDQYRMAANSDHNQVLNPPKLSLRSDNVDFQRGEMEFGTTNIYFDNYSFDLKLEEVKSTP